MPKRPETRRHPFSVFAFLLGVIAALPGCATAKDGRGKIDSAPPALDQDRIHRIYSDGDFDAAVAAIDSFTRARKDYGHGDSVFIAKHLAVIYAANPATREKGKNHMFRLLALEPTAKIVDMFVSDEIDRIFEKVKEENAVRQRSLGLENPDHAGSGRYAAGRMTAEADAEARPDPGDERERPEKGRSGTLYWVAGGAALAAVAGTSVYFLYPRKSPDIIYDLP